MSRFLVLTFGIATLATVGSAAAVMVFDPAVPYAVGDEPLGAALLDFNGDHRLDLAVTSDSPDKIQFLVGNGDGSFAAPTALLTGDATNPRGLDAGDFDNDGDQDLVVSLYGSGQVRLVLGDGAGNFTLGSVQAVGTEPAAVVAAHFNGDG